MSAITFPLHDPRKLRAAFGIAALVHLVVFVSFGISGMADKEEAKFKIVNIRLGEGGGKLELKKNTPETVNPLSAPADAAPQPPAEPAAPAYAPSPSAKTAAPAIPTAKPELPAPWRREREKGERLESKPARTLKQYVAEGENPDSTAIPETDAAVVSRYSQVLALWLYKFREYPEAALAAGEEGQAVIRLRIDRSGRVLYYSLDRSTGSPLLDEAVREMVIKATPVPEVPKHYPGGSQLEFQMPIAFSLD